MAPRPNLRSGIACLIAWLLFAATACDADPAPPAPSTAEPSVAVTSTPPPTLTPARSPASTAAPVGEVRALRLSSPARGMLRIRWTHADPSPTDYQVSWAKLSENFPAPSDDAGNAYPSVALHVVTGLDGGAVYKVRVRARHQDGSDEHSVRTGPWSATEAVRVVAPPFAPTGLTAVATHRGVVLEWDDPGDDTVSSYEVVRAFKDRFGSPHVVHIGSAEAQYLDTDVLPDLGYVYTLHAANSDGKGQASESVSVTTLARLSGRDDLYEPIATPMAPARVEWDWEPSRDSLREVVVDFTIHHDVGDWLTDSGYFLMLVHTSISGVGFYLGLQTEVAHPGAPRVRGAIFSRWETRDLANARAAPTDGWTQSAGYEGDFIGVRRAYDWGAGDYRARIAPDGREPDGEWFSFWITDLSTDITTWIGALRFPLVGGTATMRPYCISTLELYGAQTRPIDTPEWYVTVERPVGDGRPPDAVLTEYPYDDSPNAMLNSNVRYDPSEATAHFRIGGSTERVDSRQRH